MIEKDSVYIDDTLMMCGTKTTDSFIVDYRSN